MKMTFFGAKSRTDSAQALKSKNLMQKPYSESTLIAVSKGYDLTQSEMDIVRLTAAAMPLKGIAEAMNMSVDRVKTQMHSICKKTGTQDEAGTRDMLQRILS